MVIFREECWIQNPIRRPAIDEIISRLIAMKSKCDESEKSTRARSNREVALLNKVFPKHIADALARGETVEPEPFENVTILFSDIVGYTEMSSSMTPDKVCALLDRLYRQFDLLTSKYNLFKVETIGDAYMVVGGTKPEHTDSIHASVIMMGLDMIDHARTIHIDPTDPLSPTVQIRVGCHTGM